MKKLFFFSLVAIATFTFSANAQSTFTPDSTVNGDSLSAELKADVRAAVKVTKGKYAEQTSDSIKGITRIVLITGLKSPGAKGTKVDQYLVYEAGKVKGIYLSDHFSVVDNSTDFTILPGARKGDPKDANYRKYESVTTSNTASDGI